MIECKVTNDYDLIKSIYLDPDIWEKVNNGHNLDDAAIPVDAINLSITDNGESAGLVVYERYKDGVLMHPMILKKHRRKGRKFLRMALDMVKCNIYAKFPRDRRDLNNLALKFGFREIKGDCCNSYLMRLKKWVQ